MQCEQHHVECNFQDISKDIDTLHGFDTRSTTRQDDHAPQEEKYYGGHQAASSVSWKDASNDGFMEDFPNAVSQAVGKAMESPTPVSRPSHCIIG